ncbi:MAG: UbiA family prenyltransferase [Methanosarcinales archaeon]|nr:UbiA family prenyltransferase [Methanosarcinales archaeon]
MPLAAGICVVAGEIIASKSLPSISVGLMGFFIGFFISGAAMITNDYFDLEVDRINRPDRPFPSGRISSLELAFLAGLFSVAGFSAAAFLGPVVFVIAIVMWIVSNLYNWRFKETGLFGNMMVGLCLSMLFISGGAAVDKLANGMVWTFAALVFVFDLGEEIANGAMDMEGDEKRSVRSIARIYGKKHALRISGFLFALFVLISLLPFVMDWLGSVYLIIFIPMDLAVLHLAMKLITSNTIEDGRATVRQLYLSTMFFIIAFIALLALLG